MSDSTPQDQETKKRKPSIRRYSPGSLPPRTSVYLDRWAFCDGKESGTTQMVHITVARTQANEEMIDKSMLWYSRYYGITLEALEQRLLRDVRAGLRLPAIHSALEAECMERGENLGEHLDDANASEANIEP